MITILVMNIQDKKINASFIVATTFILKCENCVTQLDNLNILLKYIVVWAL